ncbi:hypothetical protein ACHQM5_022692 [Ranunculus cassubicifolius]
MGVLPSLPYEMLELIFEKICKNPLDCLSFAKVAKDWRSVAVEKRRNILPRIMILKVHEHEGLLALSSSAGNWEIPLPEVQNKECLTSNKGWLLVADSELGEIFILNPLSKDRIQLPSLPSELMHQNLKELQHTKRAIFTLKFNSICDYTVAMTFWRRVSIHRTGKENNWLTTLRFLFILDSAVDIAYYKEDIITIHNNGGVQAVEPYISRYQISTPSDNALGKYADSAETIVNKSHLVETPKKELLKVCRYEKLISGGSEQYATFDFEVFQWGGWKRTWVKVENLGEQVVFLGLNSICLSAQDVPECTPNSIYFLDYMDNSGWSDMGVFNMEEGCIKPSLHDCHSFEPAAPIWFTPNLQSKLPPQISYHNLFPSSRFAPSFVFRPWRKLQGLTLLGL